MFLMKNSIRALSFRKKIYLFIILTVLVAVMGTASISYSNNIKQIDRYYGDTTISAARNFAMLLDPEFLKELKECVLTDEYIGIRNAAVLADNEAPIEEYLRKKGLWEKYSGTRDLLTKYLNNSENVKYLYIVVLGDSDSLYDMYLFDEADIPIYNTGYYEEREPELYGIDNTGEIEPTISNGEWGWLCSSFVPVKDENGEVVCHVGCDISMDEVMADRKQFLMDVLFGGFVTTLVAVLLSAFLTERALIKPLRNLTGQMRKFRPYAGKDYEKSGVVTLEIYSTDEIQDLYQGIRQMQTEIVDYINDVSTLKKEKEQAEIDIKEKDEQIGQISRDAYKDALTGVGSKSAYNNAIEALNDKILLGLATFAIVMVDINDLKKINDMYGHERGDEYIRGCSHIVCDVLTHSPVFRIGGDEFVAILQGTDYVQREQKLTEIRKMFEKAFLDVDADPWHRYSAAVGIAEYTFEDASVESVFKRADESMYRLKKEFKEMYGSYR